MAKPGAEITNLQGFLKDLRKLSPELAREVRRDFRQAVKPAVADARARAPRKSGKLARGIRARVDSRGNAAIVSTAAHARITEKGGRHPVFGGDRWVPQPARPHVRPAVKAHTENFVRAAEHAINKAAQKAGFE